MKKTLAFLMSIICALSLTACGNERDEDGVERSSKKSWRTSSEFSKSSKNDTEDNNEKIILL